MHCIPPHDSLMWLHINSYPLTHSTFTKWCTAPLSPFTIRTHANAQSIRDKTHASIFSETRTLFSGTNAFTTHPPAAGEERLWKKSGRERGGRKHWHFYHFIEFHLCDGRSASPLIFSSQIIPAKSHTLKQTCVGNYGFKNALMHRFDNTDQRICYIT